MNEYTLHLVKRAYYKKQLLKQAADFDIASTGMTPEQIAQYNAYTELDPGFTFGPEEGGLRFDSTPDKYNDPKARKISAHSFGPNAMFKKDDAKLLLHTNVSRHPAENILNGKNAWDFTQNGVYNELLAKGYSPEEIAGFKDARTIAGITGRDAINESTIGPLNLISRSQLDPNKGGTLYIDDNGNFVNRAQGKRKGEQYGSIGGAVLGGGLGMYVGNKGTKWLNNKLGLTKDRGGWRKNTGKLLNALGTIGGAAGGAYGGYYGGKRLGAHIGDKLDPQTGTAIKMYTVNSEDGSLL